MISIILLITLQNVNTQSKFQFGWMLFLKLDFVENLSAQVTTSNILTTPKQMQKP